MGQLSGVATAEVAMLSKQFSSAKWWLPVAISRSAAIPIEIFSQGCSSGQRVTQG